MERARFRIGNTDVIIHEGDIACVPADAMITAINSGGLWWGGIDDVIQRAAGEMFHRQAAAAMPLAEGRVVQARKTGPHNGSWGDVLFIVDEFQHPLSWIVERVLRTASQEGYTSVSLPAIRTGVMLGKVEPDARTAVDQIGLGLRNFLVGRNTSLRTIHFVIYANPEVLRLMIGGQIAQI